MARTIDQPTAAIRLNTARAELTADHDDSPGTPTSSMCASETAKRVYGASGHRWSRRR